MFFKWTIKSIKKLCSYLQSQHSRDWSGGKGVGMRTYKRARAIREFQGIFGYKERAYFPPTVGEGPKSSPPTETNKKMTLYRRQWTNICLIKNYKQNRRYRLCCFYQYIVIQFFSLLECSFKILHFLNENKITTLLSSIFSHYLLSGTFPSVTTNCNFRVLGITQQ